jgi:hypothetical protein
VRPRYTHAPCTPALTAARQAEGLVPRHEGACGCEGGPRLPHRLRRLHLRQGDARHRAARLGLRAGPHGRAGAQPQVRLRLPRRCVAAGSRQRCALWQWLMQSHTQMRTPRRGW